MVRLSWNFAKAIGLGVEILVQCSFSVDNGQRKRFKLFCLYRLSIEVGV